VLGDGVVRRNFGRREHVLGAFEDVARRRAAVRVVESRLERLDGAFHVGGLEDGESSDEDGPVRQHHGLDPRPVRLQPRLEEIERIVPPGSNDEELASSLFVVAAAAGRLESGNVDGVETVRGGGGSSSTKERHGRLQ